MTLRVVKSLKILCIMCTLMIIIFTYSNVRNTSSNQSSSHDSEYNNVMQNSAKRKKNFTKEEVSRGSAFY